MKVSLASFLLGLPVTSHGFVSPSWKPSSPTLSSIRQDVFLRAVNEEFVRRLEEEVAAGQRARDELEREIQKMERKANTSTQKSRKELTNLAETKQKTLDQLKSADIDLMEKLDTLSRAESGEIGSEWWRKTGLASLQAQVTASLKKIGAGRAPSFKQRQKALEERRKELEAEIKRLKNEQRIEAAKQRSSNFITVSQNIYCFLDCFIFCSL